MNVSSLPVWVLAHFEIELKALASGLMPRSTFLSTPAASAVGSILLLVFSIAQESAAEIPEPAPLYAHSRAMREDASLRSVAFAGQLGIACGERGTILRTEDGGQTWTLRESRVDCQLSDVVWINSRSALIVGGNHDRITNLSRGVALFSSDGGLTWQRSTDRELPRLTLIQRQSNRSVVAIGDWSHSLLTHSLESNNGGRTWQAAARKGTSDRGLSPSPPPRSLAELQHWATAMGPGSPIRDVCRIGADSFCAVGEHGVISISRDEGRSWETARGKDRRSALLIVANSARTVPWSLVGSEAIEHGVRVSVLICDADSKSSATTNRTAFPKSDRDLAIANQVAVMLGASGARVMARSGDLIKTASAWIAIHRPSAIVLDESLPTEIQEALIDEGAGMRVARIATSALDRPGRTTIHRDALLPKAGVLASDMFLDALQCIAPNQADSKSVSLRYAYDSAMEHRRDNSVTSGLSLAPGQMISARLPTASRRQIQIAQARMNRDQQLQELATSNQSPSQFADSMTALLDQTAKPDQFRTAWTLLRSVSSPPKPTLRRLVLQEIGSRFTELSASRWALLQLDAIRGSVERRRLNSTLGNSANFVAAATESVPVSPFQVTRSETLTPELRPSATSPFSPTPIGSVQQVSAIAPLLVPKPEILQTSIAQNSIATEQAKLEVDLVWEFHPLALIVRDAGRHRGDGHKLQVAETESANLNRLAAGGQSEWINLLRQTGPRVVNARRAATRPRLDGVIDDDCWQSALPSAGQSQDLKFAYDEDYVYVAVTCRAPQMTTDPLVDANSTTTRDHDLQSVDRLCLSFDTDRDLMTSMQLQVSDGGRTSDSIDGNPAWQPTWYVDTRRDQEQVSFELAILRRDLVELPIPAGESWYVSAKTLAAGENQIDPVLPDPLEWTRVIFQR